MRLPNGQEDYYLSRELYSVAALTDETGTIVEAATYDTYGKVAVYDGMAQAVEESPVGNPYYFTGRRLDLLPLAGGLKQAYHCRARACDPGNGQFMQRDPAGYLGELDLYLYARACPSVLTDPLGLCPACGGDNSYLPETPKHVRCFSPDGFLACLEDRRAESDHLACAQMWHLIRKKCDEDLDDKIARCKKRCDRWFDPCDSPTANASCRAGCDALSVGYAFCRAAELGGLAGCDAVYAATLIGCEAGATETFQADSCPEGYVPAEELNRWWQ